MFYGWLLAVLGYNLKADESVASQFCAHLYKSARGCGFLATVDNAGFWQYNIHIDRERSGTMQLIIGIIIGIVVSAIGFTGVAQYADKGVQAVQNTIKEVSK